jgi:hypothetical protein
VDVETVIGQNTGFPVDEANVGLGGDDAFETCARGNSHNVLNFSEIPSARAVCVANDAIPARIAPRLRL